MKKCKKLLCVFLSLTTMLFNIVPVYASEQKYNKLLQEGFSRSFLDSIPSEMIEKIENEINDDEEITNIYTKVFYLYEGNNNEIQPCGMISEESLKLEIEAVEICLKDTNIITRVLVGISWDWEGTKPLQRKQDALTVNWDESLFVFEEDSFYSVDSGKSGEEEEWVAEHEYTRPAQISQGGLGFYSLMSATYMLTAGAAMFFLLPEISMVTGSTKVTGINVNYVHDRSFIIPINIGFNVVGFHVGFDISGFSYDEAADSANFRYSLGA